MIVHEGFNLHGRKEDNDEVYKCKNCDKIFKERILLELHVKHVHRQSKDFKNECEKCSKTFKHASQLRFHVNFQKCQSDDTEPRSPILI